MIFYSLYIYYIYICIISYKESNAKGFDKKKAVEINFFVLTKILFNEIILLMGETYGFGAWYFEG